MGNSQLIFMNGKEAALRTLFTEKFCYIAIGFDSTENGFTDSKDNILPDGFKEIEQSTYNRIPLTYVSTEFDESNGKVLVKVKGELDYSNIKASTKINQLAVVDNQTPNDIANTIFYSATKFPSFEKNSQTAMTFVLGFKL